MTTIAPAIADQPFQTAHLKVDLRRRSVRGGAIAISVQSSKFLLRMGSTVVLARLLNPEDYGLLAMVATLVGFAAIFKDMGLATATVQRPDITHPQVSNLFWINASLGAAVTVIVALCGPLLSRFYGDPRLVLVAAALSVNFLLTGLSVQHEALLARQMRFVSVGAIEITSLSAGIATGVGMAMMRCGYWSLVGMAIVTELADLIQAWTYCRWRPSLPRRGIGTRAIVCFGGDLTVSSCFNYLARNADNVLIGWYWGVIPLGLYSKAYQLFMLPLAQINTPANAVVLPALSRLHDDPKRFRHYFTRVMMLVNSLGIPLAVTMAVLSRETIRVLLGHNWMAVTPMFRILSLAAIFQPLMSSMGWLYVSTGRTKTMLRWTVAATLVIVAAFIIGLPYGAIGVAVSYAIARLLLLGPSLITACHGTPVRVRDILGAIAEPVAAGVLCAGVCLVAQKLLYAAGMGMLGVFFIGSAASLSAAAALLIFGFGNLGFYSQILRDLRPKK